MISGGDPDPGNPRTYVKVVGDEDYTGRIDDIGSPGHPFYVVHMDVYRWSPSIAKKITKETHEYFDTLDCPVYVAYALDGWQGKMLLKFIKRMGMIPFDVGLYEGVPCMYFIKETR